MAKRRSTVHGVLVVDKPRGPTSHDVVGWARRAFGTRSVGHAGTLDPMATGVLVLAVGEGTKLVRWLTADDKAYEATLTLGEGTDTLDAEGEVIETAEVPTLEAARVAEVAASFVGASKQLPPKYSAIRVDGKRLHEAAREGLEVEIPERDVVLHSLDVRVASPDELSLTLRSAKGFYVRSLGRDLARALGTVGHLTMLRRTASGAFGVGEAFDGERLRAAREDDDAKTAAHAALMSLEDACRAMPAVHLTPEEAEDAHHGRPVRREAPEASAPFALFDPSGQLVAIADRSEQGLQVVRGIRR